VWWHVVYGYHFVPVGFAGDSLAGQGATNKETFGFGVALVHFFPRFPFGLVANSSSWMALMLRYMSSAAP